MNENMDALQAEKDELCELVKEMNPKQIDELTDAAFALRVATDEQKEKLDSLLKEGNIESVRNLIAEIISSANPYEMSDTMKLIGQCGVADKKLIENQGNLTDIYHAYLWRTRYDERYKDNDDAVVSAMYDAYLYGFICGQRAERKKKKERG